MLVVIRAAQSAKTHSRRQAFEFPRIHAGELPSLLRPGLFGD